MSLLKGLSNEKVVVLGRRKLPFVLKGIVRLVDGKGRTLGIVLDPEALLEIEEEVEASSPEFLESLKRSRLSGRVNGEEVRKKSGLK